MHARDYADKKVRLLQEITTRGKSVYPAGTVMIASQYGNRRDKLTLQSVERKSNGCYDYVTRVDKSNVEIVKDDQ